MKKTLREQALMTRKALTRSDVMEKSKQIKHRLFASSWYLNARIILFYVSYDNEVNTHDMIQESLMNKKTVVVPKTDIKEKKLIISKITCWDDLERGAYNIFEPKKECLREVPLDSMDVVIIPGVAFNMQGNRIGHGYGYYDRLLQKMKKIPKIGLAFECQLVESIPAQMHDVKVEKIITEKRVIICH